MNTLNRHGPTLFRGWLYFMAAFLAEFVPVVVVALRADRWPTPQGWMAATLLGLPPGFIVLRAFYDGHTERRKQDLIKSDAEQKTRSGTASLPGEE